MATILGKDSLYHLSGDSIVTTVLVAILGSLFDLDYVSVIKNTVNKLINKKEK